MNNSKLVTRCCKCDLPFQIFPSMSMQMGVNTGHVTCPKCKAFLHVEILEGNEAWTEPWEKYIDREKRGPSPIIQRTQTEK